MVRVAWIATNVWTTPVTTGASASTVIPWNATLAFVLPGSPATTASSCKRSKSCDSAWEPWPSYSSAY